MAAKGSPPRWLGASALIAQPGYQCCVIYISHFMLHISSKVCNFHSFTKMLSWTQNFRLGLVGLMADHDASRGSPSGLPGGPCASSVIILPLDPHLVDASVNFEDLGYLLTFKMHIW